MRKWIVLVAAMMLLTCFGAAQAQDKMGIGLVIFDRDLVSVVISQLAGSGVAGLTGGGGDFSLLMPPSKFMIPLTFGTMKIEPEFGWMRYSKTTKATQYVTEQKASLSALRIGCGIFSVKNVKKVDVYFGGRVGIILASNSATAPDPSNALRGIETTTSKTDFYVGPCFGGEYMISDNFSFGGEAQLIYSSIGEPTTKVAGKEQPKSGVSSSMIDTRYLFIFRWYK
jgi:hypothetical protein